MARTQLPTLNGAPLPFAHAQTVYAMQHLPRLMGRGRALEVLLCDEDFDAELAERYGWINRALAPYELDDFVGALAQRIARFPAAALAAIKDRVGAITLAPTEALRIHSNLFLERASDSVTAPQPGRHGAGLPDA